MRHIISVFFSFCFLCTVSIQSLAKITVNVTVNINQPPYSIARSQQELDKNKGLVLDLVTALNELQAEYQFVLHTVTAERTKRGIQDGVYDLVAMSNLDWGYDKTILQSSKNLLAVKDVFFTLKSQIENIHFSDIGTEKISTIVVRGFSYHFLNFERDKRTLETKFNTLSVLSEPEVLTTILANRANIGVSSSTTLDYFALNNPAEYQKLHLYKQPDSEYFRHFLVRKKGKISLKTLDALFVNLAESGELTTIFARYGLTPADLMARSSGAMNQVIRAER
jgi:ABC-type amino acid transport substrate-binding protein